MGGGGGQKSRDLLQEEFRGSNGSKRRRLVISLVLLAILGGCAVSFAVERSQFEWASPYLVAPSTLTPETATGYHLNAVSCSSVAMCVAVDREGNAFTSTDPSSGGDSWTRAPIDPNAGLMSVSCPDASLCVAADGVGNMLTSTDPANGKPTWSVGEVTTDLITEVACPGISLCVAVDVGGEILSSTSPSTGAFSWKVAPVDQVAGPLTGVSCASTTLCVASDAYGDILTSTDPAGGVGAWEIAAIDERELLLVSCARTGRCVALDAQGNILASTDSARGGGSWKQAGSIGAIFPAALDCANAIRCVAFAGGDAHVSDSPTDETWSDETVSSHEELSGISCPTVTQCVGVDSLGHAVLGSGQLPSGTLSVTLLGTGHGTVAGTGISCPASCSATFGRGSSVSLAATPAPGSYFGGWGGPCAGSGACVVTVERATEVDAVFGLTPIPPGFSLDITIGGSGAVAGPGFICPPRCHVPLAAGNTITLASRPSAGWMLGGWSGACQRAGRCRISGDGNESLKALFVRSERPRVSIRAIHVDRRTHTVTIQLRINSSAAALRCILRRRGAHSATRRSRCRTRMIYRGLAGGAYVFAVDARSGRTAYVRRAFAVR